MICCCGECVVTESDRVPLSTTGRCKLHDLPITSASWCENPYVDWFTNFELRGVTSSEAVQHQCGSPWPRLVYYGPAHQNVVTESCPVLHQGKSGYVYHLLDEWGSALYIGKSKQPGSRAFDHQIKSWWKFVRTVRIFASKEYHSLETADIAYFMPRYNVANNNSLEIFVKEMPEEYLPYIIREVRERYRAL